MHKGDLVVFTQMHEKEKQICELPSYYGDFETKIKWGFDYH